MQVKIKVQNENNTDREFLQAVHLLYHLRLHTRRFRKDLGTENRREMEVFELKADEWLKEHVIINNEKNG